MPRKILIAIGSPRKNGNSASLARQVAAGAREAGAKLETVFLQGMNIRPCTACDACRKKLKKDCIIKDDMRALYPRIKAADGIVIASPIYWFTVSAQTKLFMDRWYALGGDDGYDLAGKKFGVVLAYADADPFSSGAVNALSHLQGRPEHGRFAATIHREFDVAVERMLAVKGCARLLDSEPTLQRSIRLRNPYVDPIHLMQADLLGRWRESGRQDRELFDALVASVNGIALGLQGSG